MTWTEIEQGAEFKTACRRFAVYATPEGFVAIDFRGRSRPVVPVVSEPFPTATEAKRWCERREAVAA